MWKSLVLAIMLLCLVSACGDRQSLEKLEFQSTSTIQAQLISNESLIIGYPYDFFVTNSELFVLCFKDGKWIHSFDRASGQELRAYVERGRGPGDCLMCTKLYYDNHQNRIYLFDRDTEKIVEYDLNPSGASFVSEKSFANVASTVFYHVWPMSEDTYLANSQHGSIEDGITRFQVYSNDGDLLQENSQIPHLEGDDRYSYTQSSMSISPDKKHLVSVTLMGEILDIYDLNGNTLKKAVEKMFSVPNVVYQSGVVRETKDTKWGFPYVSSDNDYIYASMTDDYDPNYYNKIAIFDWKGRGIKRIETDYNVLRLYPYGRDIFAIVADSTNQLFFAKFPDAIPAIR